MTESSSCRKGRNAGRGKKKARRMLRATATSDLKGIVTLTAIQSSGFGPPASRDVCRYSFLSIFDRALQRELARAQARVPLRLLLHELVQ